MYKMIEASDNPVTLLSDLADRLVPLSKEDITFRCLNEEKIKGKEEGIYKNFMHFFKSNTYYNE